MDVIFDHSLKNNSGNRDNKTYVLCPTLQKRTEEDVYRRFEKHNYVLSFIHCHGMPVYIVFFTVNTSINVLAIILPAEVSLKRHYIKDFSQDYVSSLCGVVVRCSRIEPMVEGSSPTELFFFPSFFFFPFFCVVVFYKYIAK